MKILQLCLKPPLPAVDGGCIAMNNITQGLLTQGHDVKIISISTSKHPFQKKVLPKEYIAKTRFEAVYVETKINLVDAFSALVTSDNYNVSRFFSPDFDRVLMNCIQKEKFDIILLESVFMTPYLATIRRFSKSKVVLRSHNLEYMIWQRAAGSEGNIAKKMYLNHLAKQLKIYEIDLSNQVDGIAAISVEDQKKYENFGCEMPLVTIPFGIDLADYIPKPNTQDKFDIFHIGAMDWKPNIEGMYWFKNQVMPLMKNVTLHMAGRSMPKSFLKEEDNVINHGEVDCAHSFMSNHGAMIVPLFSAGGMRVKIIEGMALERVVISTSIGAEGINCTDGHDILIANTAEEFVAQIEKLKNNPKLGLEIAKNARKLIEREYNNQVITDNLIGFYQSILG